MSRIITLENKHYSIEEVCEIALTDTQIQLSEELKTNIQRGYDFLHNYLAKNKRSIYGINTGFGALCNTKISDNQLSQLQENLVLSHACGTGNIVPQEIARLMLLLKILGLSKGKSGVALSTVERLVFFFNHNIIPVIYEQGSLGASGDLAPLAHLSLPLIGKGKVWYNNQITDAEKVLSAHQLSPLKLQAKEGLALLNGTQFMSAYASYILYYALRYAQVADKIAALSLDAFFGKTEPFHPAVHQARPHKGQIETAQNILSYLDGSEITQKPKEHVQDPYSFRCIPQVHGASKDAINYCKSIVETEINSVTDNPTVLPDEECIISAGNFHGQPLALSLDFLAVALAELASISERRTYKLISGTRDLPAFLVANPGLNSGFMIAQYTAASIVSQNKQLCTPASVDTIDSSNGQEDHVSMGANAATKTLKVLNNLESVLAIELLHAAQALEFRRPLKTSETLERLVADYRKFVPFIENDTFMHPYIEQSKKFIRNLY
ncbi:MAG: histidine ammonia-lyase [Bacteroidetes bacterium]|nr:MAG: histidine ammonia-lyase [Bacteroidota bacterium]